jgi:hypothetical protein
MSLLTNEQINEISELAGLNKDTRFIFKIALMEWNQEQSSELLDALKETREHLYYISEWDMPIITKPVIDRCIAILEK